MYAFRSSEIIIATQFVESGQHYKVYSFLIKTEPVSVVQSNQSAQIMGITSVLLRFSFIFPVLFATELRADDHLMTRVSAEGSVWESRWSLSCLFQENPNSMTAII